MCFCVNGWVLVYAWILTTLSTCSFLSGMCECTLVCAYVYTKCIYNRLVCAFTFFIVIYSSHTCISRKTVYNFLCSVCTCLQLLEFACTHVCILYVFARVCVSHVTLSRWLACCTSKNVIIYELAGSDPNSHPDLIIGNLLVGASTVGLWLGDTLYVGFGRVPLNLWCYHFRENIGSCAALYVFEKNL